MVLEFKLRYPETEEAQRSYIATWMNATKAIIAQAAYEMREIEYIKEVKG